MLSREWTIRPRDAARRAGIALLVIALTGCAETNPTSTDDVSTSGPLTIQEQIDAAAFGDTVHINEGTYEESLVLPSGIHLCGEEGAKVVITPPADTPGIVLINVAWDSTDVGSGSTEDPDFEGGESAEEENAGSPRSPGAPPINIIAPATQGAKSRICNLTVQSATGHGILSQGVSLELENVKIDDTLRAGDESPGHGVHIEEAASLLAIDVQVTGSTGVGVSVVNVMDVKFTVTDFVATPDPDAIGVIWPEYMPDPETMGASLVSGNDGGGISVVWPDYMPNPDGSAPVQAVAIEGVSIAENGRFGMHVEGCALSLDQTVISGTLLPESSSDPLDITTANGQGILAKNAISVTMNNCIVEKNAGAGLVSAESGPLLLGGQNGIPRPSGGDGGEVGVIWPEYLPSNHFFYNAGGGLALIDPIDPEAGKADEASDAGNRIAGASFAGNGRFGMQIEGATLAIERTVIRDTTRQPDASDGDGLRVLGGKSTSNVTLDASSIVTDNEGFGVRAGSGAAVAIASEISKNNDGGVWARGKGAAISLQPDARIANNRAVGVAVLEEALLSVDSATIEGTTRTLASDPLFGDAIWAVKTAGLNISGATIRNNARVGLLLGSPPASATLKDITFADNAYGMVSLKSDSVQVSEYPDCEDCSFEDNTISNEEAGLCLEIYLDCNPSIEPGCEPFNPCGDCSCPEDVVCTEENCTAPCEQDSDCWDDTCKNYQCAQETWQCVAPPDDAKLRTVGSCDDGNACTVDDICSDGIPHCEGVPDFCDDENLCTTDSCHPVTGCDHVEVQCSVDDPCVSEVNCVVDSGCTDFVYMVEGYPCEDGNDCTFNGLCTEGKCASDDFKDCNDANPCTNDVCDPDFDCLYESKAPNTPCDDGSVCTVDDLCQADACVPGTELDCNDSNVCTEDSCHPVNGCQFVNKENEKSCKGTGDGNPCTEEERCLEGVCGCNNANTGSCPTFDTGAANFTILDCDDGEPCSHNFCDPSVVGGCVANALGLGAACDDGDACTTNTSCAGAYEDSSCEGGIAINSPECPDLSSVYTCATDGYEACSNPDVNSCGIEYEDFLVGSIKTCDFGDPDSACTCLEAHELCDSDGDGVNEWASGGSYGAAVDIPQLCISGPAENGNPGAFNLQLDIGIVPNVGQWKFYFANVQAASCDLGSELALPSGVPFTCHSCPGKSQCVVDVAGCGESGDPPQILTIPNVAYGHHTQSPPAWANVITDRIYICAMHAESGAYTGWVRVDLE